MGLKPFDIAASVLLKPLLITTHPVLSLWQKQQSRSNRINILDIEPNSRTQDHSICFNIKNPNKSPETKITKVFKTFPAKIKNRNILNFTEPTTKWKIQITSNHQIPRVLAINLEKEIIIVSKLATLIVINRRDGMIKICIITKWNKKCHKIVIR